MSILGSRHHQCINESVAESSNPVDLCQKLNQNPIKELRCPYYNNLKNQSPSMSNSIWDIEDLTQILTIEEVSFT